MRDTSKTEEKSMNLISFNFFKAAQDIHDAFLNISLSNDGRAEGTADMTVARSRHTVIMFPGKDDDTGSR